jgi:isoleucyl-tRNA synthetase
VTYARLAGWSPSDKAPAVADRGPLDRWILARTARLANEVELDLKDYDALDAARAIDGFVEELSTWYLRLSRDRMRLGSRSDGSRLCSLRHSTKHWSR